jgi:PAB-dependent poly(A)-specific ribonuclease subunit 2
VCGVEVSKPASCYSHDLIYTPTVSVHLQYVAALLISNKKSGSRHAKNARVTFSQILKKSIEKDLNAKGFCHNCRGYKMLSSRKVTHQLPVVLTLLAGNINDEHRRLWATPGWLPEEIGIIVANGEFFCYEGDELKSLLDRQQRGQLQHHMLVYSLTALAVDIDTGSKEGHLVAMANGM